MLLAKDFQIGCAFYSNGSLIVMDEEYLEVLMGARNYHDYKPVILTLKIIRDNLGFHVSDMGDFWQCELNDFVLVRPKFHLKAGVDIPFVFGFKTTTPHSITFQYAHHLQIVYRSLFNKDLEWKE